MSLHLTRKAILLVCVPVLLDLMLLGAVAVTLGRTDEAARQEMKAQEMYGHLNTILAVQLQRVAITCLRTSAPTQASEAQLAALKNKLQSESAAVTKIGLPDLIQTEKFKNLTMTWQNLDETFKLARTLSTKDSKSTATFEYAKAQNYLDDLIQSSQQLQDAQLAIIIERRKERQRLAGEMQTALWAAALGSVVAAACLLAYFMRGTAARLQALLETGRSMAAGRVPQKTLSGADELAEIDGAFQKVHGQLSVLRQREHAILENLDEIVCSIDEDLRFSDINPAVVRVWGYKPEELLGKRVNDFTPKDDQKAAAKTLRDAMQLGAGETQRFSLKITRADGTISDTEWQSDYIAGSHSLCCVVHARGALAAGGSRGQAQAPAQLQAQTHAPAQATAQGPAQGPAQVQSQTLTPAQIQAQMQARMEPQGQLILPAVQAAVAGLSGQAQNNKVTVGVYIDPNLQACFDREGLSRVLAQLLDNALRFSPPAGQVRIVAVPTEGEEKGFVRLAVIDQGPGIPLPAQAHIFARQGTGLAHCKALVEQQRGKIGVKSVDGNGCTFWFTLPLQS